MPLPPLSVSIFCFSTSCSLSYLLKRSYLFIQRKDNLTQLLFSIVSFCGRTKVELEISASNRVAFYQTAVGFQIADGFLRMKKDLNFQLCA